MKNPELLAQAAAQFPQQIILGLDARAGKVATEGWDETSSIDAIELALQAKAHAIEGIVYTDIDRDGMMSGLNVEATLKLAQNTQVPVIASGGVTTLSDLSDLKSSFKEDVDLLLGAITGRAIYEGSLDLAEGQAFLDA